MKHTKPVVVQVPEELAKLWASVVLNLSNGRCNFHF